jgi:hypothetical protein
MKDGKKIRTFVIGTVKKRAGKNARSIKQLGGKTMGIDNRKAKVKVTGIGKNKNLTASQKRRLKARIKKS